MEIEEKDKTIKARLSELKKEFQFSKNHLVGYPANNDFDYSALLPLLQYSINNVGDPFCDSNYSANTHEIERQVISFFADLMHLKQNQSWGYVTNGGTEGNLFNMYIGREYLPENAITYFSEDSHYSIFKIAKILKLNTIVIKSQPTGEINYDDLAYNIKKNRDKPALVMINVGTTMKGAFDDVTKIKTILSWAKVKKHYIHADCALGGMILPFVSEPTPYGFKNGFDSCSISGHKFIGSPIPCGITLTKNKYINEISQSVEYIEALDTTLMGSRNGFTPLILWYAIKKHGTKGFKKMVDDMLENAEYTVNTFNKHGIKAWKNKNSITCIFPRPHHDITKKWSIATQGNIAHIITMQHVTKPKINKIIKEIVKEKSESIELT